MLNLTGDPEIRRVAGEIREKAAFGGYVISDVILREGGVEYQFVDLVMEGGGTLGVALVGYIHALEQANVRFLGMGGSSVGAIVALLAYGCGGRMEAKGERLAGIIGGMDLGSLVDDSRAAKMISKLFGEQGVPFSVPKIILNLVLSLRQIVLLLRQISRTLGLNSGDMLYEWIADNLAEYGIHTLAELNALTGKLPEGLTNRITGEPITEYDASIRIVAADVTTSTKVVFPEMAPMYWQEPEGVNPACFARASASIPLFFQPFNVGGISEIIEGGGKWERLGSFKGTLPGRVSFVDGGLLSNFPIDLFKRNGVPRAPTLGARLGNKDRSAKDITSVGQYAGGLLSALRHYADYDFIFKNPLYKYLIAHIPTEKYHWLDFNMGPEEKLGLFREGFMAGHRFLEGFDWEQYKELRRAEIEIYRAHEKMKK